MHSLSITCSHYRLLESSVSSFSDRIMIPYVMVSQLVLVIKNLPANAGDSGDSGLIPELERSSGGGNGSPLQYSCLENFMDRGAWWATVRGVTKSWAWVRKHTATATHTSQFALCFGHIFFFFLQNNLGNRHFVSLNPPSPGSQRGRAGQRQI